MKKGFRVIGYQPSSLRAEPQGETWLRPRLAVWLVVVGLLMFLLSCGVDPSLWPTPHPSPTSWLMTSPTPEVGGTKTVRFYAQTTNSYYGATDDGEIYGTSGTYSTARSTSSTCSATGLTSRIGQDNTYNVYRTYLDFDTSGIPDDATVNSAVLYVCAGADSSNTDFNVQVYRYAWAEALCSNREANYDGAYGASAALEGTLRNTSSGWSNGTYYTMTVATAGISVTGDSKYTVVSSRDVGGNTPIGNEYVAMYLTEQTGTDKDPYLQVTYTEAPTPTNTPTNTPTPTPTSTPTPTAMPCPIKITADTTWGPGLINVNCSIGVARGVTLTLAPGTTVRFTGAWMMDVKGCLYAVGTASDPITFTSGVTRTAGAWEGLYLRGVTSTLEYVNVYYGLGVNDVDPGSVLRYCNLMTNTYGLATMTASDVMSCTIQYNDIGLLMYGASSPEITACNVLSNTIWDAQVDQDTGVTVSGCWWGVYPPDEELVWDEWDSPFLGRLERSDSAASWVSW